MLHERPPIAVQSAALQLGVEGIEHVGIDRADLRRADHGGDVVLEEAAVAPDRGFVEVSQVEVSQYQLVDCGARSRLTPLVDLNLEAPQHLGGLLLGLGGGGRNGLREVVTLLRHRSMPA